MSDELQSGTPNPPPPELPALSPEELQRLGLKLKGLLDGHERNAALDIGRELFEVVFAGSEELVRRNSKTKTQSMRTVAEAMGKSTSYLSRAIGVHLLARAHGGLERWPQLSISHFRAVLGLPPERQGQLLDQAQAEGWDVARLDAASSDGNLARARGPQAEALFEVHRALRALSRMLTDSDGLMADLGTAGIPGHLVEGLAAALRQTEQQVQGIHEVLAPPAAGAEVRP